MIQITVQGSAISTIFKGNYFNPLSKQSLLLHLCLSADHYTSVVKFLKRLQASLGISIGLTVDQQEHSFWGLLSASSSDLSRWWRMERLVSALRPSMASSKSVAGKLSRSFIQASQVVKIGATTHSADETFTTTFLFQEPFLLFSGFMHLVQP